MILKDLVNEELINVDMRTDSKETFFMEIANYLKEKGYVKESFGKAILSRENEFPTGLDLNGYSVAIPHTDTKHILKPFVLVNKLKDEIEFTQMATDDSYVRVKDILVLGIKEPKEQVHLLSNIIDKFSDPAFVSSYKNTNDKSEVLELLKRGE